MISESPVSRRNWLRSGLALGGAAFLGLPPLQADETPIPFLDPQPVRPERPMIQWEQLNSWITPNDQFFFVAHYGYPDTRAEGWSLSIEGLVEKPRSISIEELKRMPKREFTATLECAGNGSSPGFMGGIGNARWTGTPLAPILKQCGIRKEGIEVVFYGADQGTEKIRGREYPQNFARSLAVDDALSDKILVCWEMNGQPLDNKHGGPLRLVVPGWYGVAWVKWMNRIEVQDRRYMGRFMGRDYVTIRGEQRGDQVIWREMSVGRMNLKSIVARVTRLADGTIRIAGAVWNDGTPLRSVELKIDSEDWTKVRTTEGANEPHCWKFWTYDWKNAPAGEHTLVSRASDARGVTQPAADDPEIAMKRTYWEAFQQTPRRIRL